VLRQNPVSSACDVVLQISDNADLDSKKKQLVISSVFCRLYFAEISNDFTTIISTFYNNVQMLTLMNAVGVI